MTHREILEKAIQKAIDGGWDGGRFRPLPLDLNRWRFDSDYDAFGIGQYEDEIWIEPCEYIFNHEFAKSLFGEDTIHVSLAGYHEDSVPIWKYRLQEMVISDDPIKYLGANL